MKIFWNTNYSSKRNDGYKTSSEDICKYLTQLDLEITHLGTTIDSDTIAVLSNVGIEYEPEIPLSENDILVNNVLPDGYKVSKGYNIGFSYWETTKIPESWVARMNLMDEIWTTSKWASDVFIECGVKVPVYYFNLGVDSSLYYPVKRQKKTPFTFLSIGSPSTRKNSQLTVDAFLKILQVRPDCKLIYKTIDSPDARINPKTDNMRPLSTHPDIEIIDADLDLPALAALYDRINCVVYPTSGEGWGLFPFQAIVKGIPTICTKDTACSEYAHLSIPLDFKWGTMNMTGLYENNGVWMEPNVNQLYDKMLDVIDDYDEYAEFTFDNARLHFDQMIWEGAIKGYYDRLCQILNA